MEIIQDGNVRFSWALRYKQKADEIAYWNIGFIIEVYVVSSIS